MVDIVLILYILANIYMGWRYGVSRRLLHFGGFYIGILMAGLTSVELNKNFGWANGDHPQSSHFWIYLGVVVFLVVVFEVLGFAYAGLFRFITAIIFDRVGGALVAIVASVLEIAVIVFMFTAMVSTAGPGNTSLSAETATIASQVSDSPTVKLVRLAETAALLLFRPALPADTNTYFAKSFT